MTGGVKSHDCQPPMLDDSLPRVSSSLTTLTKSSILSLPTPHWSNVHTGVGNKSFLFNFFSRV